MEKLPKNIRRLRSGTNMLLFAGICAASIGVFCLWFAIAQHDLPVKRFVISLIIGILFTALLVAISLVKLFFSSSQMTVTQRVLLIFLWWLPLYNIYLFGSIYSVTRREYRQKQLRFRRNEKRRDNMVCKTKYPILMVHGIFFRDWEYFNYWGRIPKELDENGARIFYGGQESSAAVQKSAEQLRDCILDIIEKEQCEKVNIIAHSKGGLDSRYAISLLGMDEYVASLTTINTPHRGCRFAKKALDNVPEGLVSAISKKYDLLFSKLGDKHPDFYSGVSELTDEACEELNKIMPQMEGVYYQSIGSKMAGAKAAPFPLNLGYGIVKLIDGDNDGLVHTQSMPWGDSYRQINPTGKLGISHGDMIDLSRKDIKGFDVCETYVGLVSELKEKGL